MRKQPNSRSCFICGMENVAGVRVAFYDTTDAEGRPEVLARFKGETQHQGYPQRMHGGVIAGILDEAAGRAINAGAVDGEATVWGVSFHLEVSYRLPVPLGLELTARGRLTRNHSRMFEARAELHLPDGKVAATATGRYVKLGFDEITDEELESLGWEVYADEALGPPRRRNLETPET